MKNNGIIHNFVIHVGNFIMQFTIFLSSFLLWMSSCLQPAFRVQPVLLTIYQWWYMSVALGWSLIKQNKSKVLLLLSLHLPLLLRKNERKKEKDTIHISMRLLTSFLHRKLFKEDPQLYFYISFKSGEATGLRMKLNCSSGLWFLPFSLV